MWARRLGAICIQMQGVIVNAESAIFGDFELAFLDLGVIKLFDAAALQTYQMIVMITFIELEDGLAAFKMMAHEQASLLKLRQHTIDRGKANIGVFLQKHFV